MVNATFTGDDVFRASLLTEFLEVLAELRARPATIRCC